MTQNRPGSDHITHEEPSGAQGPDVVSRRVLLAGAVTVAGGALLRSMPASTRQGATGGARPSPSALPAVTGPADPTKVVGTPTSAVSGRSPYERPARTPVGLVTGSSETPLQDLAGTITPSDLHFERLHAGVPLIDPTRHTLTIHGLVDRPLVFTLADLKRFPSVSRVHFIECSGNGRAAYAAPRPDMTPQQVDGLCSNTEWTGVLLATLLREVGIRPNAKWLLAEGGDACLMARSIPVEKALDDAIIAYAQNGEALRPSNGYPVRLVLPGWEGNTNVKWIRRIEVGTEPWMTRWETAKYTDPLPGDKARMFAFPMDAKSIITFPAYPSTLPDRGWWRISGLAWSGRGVVTGVEVTTDGGKTWRPAVLQDPTLPKALTRFTHMWQWDGRESVLMSRAYDDTGYVQPGYAVLRKVRGIATDYHFNPIRGWRVKSDGSVVFEAET